MSTRLGAGPRQWYRGLSRRNRRFVLAGAIAAAVGMLLVVALFVIYPRVGEWMIRSKLVPRLETKLGRKITIGEVDIGLGHAVLRGVVVRGPADGDKPLATVDRVDVEFDTWKSFFGTADLEQVVAHQVAVALERRVDRDNFNDLAIRLGLRRAPADTKTAPASMGSLRPRRMVVRQLQASFVDDVVGAKIAIGGGSAELARDKPARATLRQVAVSTTAGPGADFATLSVERPAGGEPAVTINGGELRLWPKLALSGITGAIVPGEQPGRYDVDLAGGYGGVAGTLWTAQGWIDPRAGTGVIDATADEFTLDRLAPILEKSPVKEFKDTRIDAKLHVDVGPDTTTFTGNFHLVGLNVGHPMLAESDITGLDLGGELSGSFARASRTLIVERGAFVTDGMPFEVTGSWRLPGGAQPDGTRRPRHAIDARFIVPPIDCQKALVALPDAMVPYLEGYVLAGRFKSDIKVAIDWADLEKTVLDGSVRIRDCRVVAAPDSSPRRLQEPFEHFVEAEIDNWLSFEVGPDNPDFVPITEISPYLMKSLMTTEDSGFYSHRGFIVREFRSALIKNLQARKYRYGASSITMQTVKNVLLYRGKTLARKFQELFLTWDIENVLSKDRIFEIYLNVIEYGPALYGIGPAARYYFGKHPRDLNPVEAAFFSSILPDPKGRHKQFCQGTLTQWTSGKIERILAKMLERKRLTDEEYQKALATPLLFRYDGTESEKECLERTTRAIKKARPTNPMIKR